jgi:hypothetical protein
MNLAMRVILTNRPDKRVLVFVGEKKEHTGVGDLFKGYEFTRWWLGELNLEDGTYISRVKDDKRAIYIPEQIVTDKLLVRSIELKPNRTLVFGYPSMQLLVDAEVHIRIADYVPSMYHSFVWEGEESYLHFYDVTATETKGMPAMITSTYLPSNRHSLTGTALDISVNRRPEKQLRIKLLPQEKGLIVLEKHKAASSSLFNQLTIWHLDKKKIWHRVETFEISASINFFDDFCLSNDKARVHLLKTRIGRSGYESPATVLNINQAYYSFPQLFEEDDCSIPF